MYRALGLNLPRRTRRRLPARIREPLEVPQYPDQVWSADFMSDSLYHGTRFRTFTLIDDFNREALYIEIDTSLRAPRVVRTLERLKAQGRCPETIRVDNGPEFLSDDFRRWCRDNGVVIQYIQPGKPNQNAYIDRFNRTYRNEVLNLDRFRSLDEVREITGRWLMAYNDQRPHDALGGLPPSLYAKQVAGNSTSKMST